MKIYLPLLLSFAFVSALAQRPFITTWKTDNPGSSEDNQITIPTRPAPISTFVYDYTVDWGDGTSDENVAGDITHTYSTPGTYTVSITGDFPWIYFFNEGDKDKILTVEQWGDIQWGSMNSAFRGCSNLRVVATDAPDLNLVDDFVLIFADAVSFNDPIDHWDVSTITSMFGSFSNATSFNQPLTNWDVSNVTNMGSMFSGAESFNQPLNAWDVSRVTSMGSMFSAAFAFDQPLDNWDVSAVTSMLSMFSGISGPNTMAFNQDISMWDVSNVTFMQSMFSRAKNFNQPIGNWNVGAVTTMRGMLFEANNFNQDISSWDVSNVTDMRFMLDDSDLSISNYDLLLNAWSTLPGLQSDVEFTAAGIQYCEGATQRDFLINSKNWSITDEGFSCIEVEGATFDIDENTENGTRVFTLTYSSVNGQSLTVSETSDEFDIDPATRELIVVDSTGLNHERTGGNGLFAFTVTVTNEDLEESSFEVFYAINDVNEVPVAENEEITIEENGEEGLVIGSVSAEDPDEDVLSYAIISGNTDDAFSIDGSTGEITINNSSAIDFELNPSFLLSIEVSDPGGLSDLVEVAIELTNVTEVPFITTWKTDNPGDTEDNQISIPTLGSGYDYTVDWGDGTSDINVTESITHTYAEPGTYTVSISGDFPHIRFFISGDKEKILTVEQWGDGSWSTMRASFTGCVNLRVNATDAPNLSMVTDMASMFEGATAFNDPVNHWDVSNVTDISGIFKDATSFDKPLVDWDVSNVTDMTSTFENAIAFDQTLDSWETGKVTNMQSVFKGAVSFNQPVGSWDMGSLVNASSMFEDARVFNQPIGTWDVSNVFFMDRMFRGALDFNQDISAWDVSEVVSMLEMFSQALDFNHPLDSWNVSNVTNMRGMFLNSDAFNQPLNSWNVSNVTDMDNMFNDAGAFNQPLDSWDVSAVTDMRAMFNAALSFNQSLNTWDVSSVTNMSSIFRSALAFNQDLSAWDVSNVTDFSSAFRNATSFNQPLDSWNVSNASSIASMFESAEAFNQDISNWDVSNVTSMRALFNGASSFDQPLNGWNVSTVTDMSFLFRETPFNQPLDQWNVSSVTSMTGMFQSSEAFNQNIDGWDVSNVTDMQAMFSLATSFNQPLNSWNTVSLTTIKGIFQNANSFDQPLSSWDVSSVVDMEDAFNNMSSFNQSLADWDVTSVTNMTRIFSFTESISIENYDATIAGWSQLENLQNGVTVGSFGQQYCLSADQRQKLIDDFGWTFDFDEFECFDNGDLTGALARSGAIGFSVSGSSFFGLGRNDDGYFNDFYHLDVEAEVLEARTSFPGVARSGAISFVIDDKAYVGLGQDENGDFLSDFYSYDGETDTWTQLANFGGGVRSDAVAFTIDGSGYVGTGINDTDEQDDLWRYDPASNSWEQMSDLPSDKRRGAFAFAARGKGYVGGGYNFDGFQLQLSDIQEYDPVTNTWTERIFADGINLSVNDAAAFSLYGFGYIAYGNKDQIVKYNPVTNEVQNLGDVLELGDNRNDPVAFVQGDSAIIGLGSFSFFPTEYSSEFNFYFEENITPSNLTMDNTTIEENNETGITIGLLSVEDADEFSGHTYSLVSGDGSNDVDNGSFLIVQNQLVANEIFDFETQTIYRIFLEAIDSRGGTTSQSFEIQITDQNESPTSLLLSVENVFEVDNDSEIFVLAGELSTADPDAGDTFTYSIVEGDGTNDMDNDRFAINGAQLSVFSPNFEEQSDYRVNIQSQDQDGESITEAFVVSVQDRNDTPTELNFVQEEIFDTDPVGTLAGTFSTLDEDDIDFTYRITDSGVNAFMIEGNRLLTNIDFKTLNFTEDAMISISVETSDGNGGLREESFEVLIKYVEVLGLPDEEITIFPNPATANITISEASTFDRFEIVSLSGKQVKRGLISERIDVSDLVSGTYLLRLFRGDVVNQVKFLKD